MLSITKQYHFSYGHHLPGHELCGSSHGHNGVLEIEIEGVLRPNGMVLDFHDLDEIVNPFLSEWDHKNLNEVLEITPTAEHMANLVANHMMTELFNLDPHGNRRLKVIRVRMYETEKCWAEWKA